MSRYHLNACGEVCDHGEPMSPLRLKYRLEAYERDIREILEARNRSDAEFQRLVDELRGKQVPA